MENRRKNYRTAQLSGISVSIAWDGENFIDGQLLDLSARGVAVAFKMPVPQIPAVLEDARVLARFEIEGLDPIADVTALVRNVREIDDTQVFGMQILDWQTLHNRLPPRLFSAFNRRRHFRVNLPPETRAVVSREDDPNEATVQVSNLSVGGCQLLYPLERLPEIGQRLRLRFRLPGSSETLDLNATLRNVIDAQSYGRCGLEFEKIGSRDEQELMQYIMRRQREMR
jgi:c-di-GMP-binding flagellar brake protein YcgR